MFSKRVIYDNLTNCFVRISRSVLRNYPRLENESCVNIFWEDSSLILWCIFIDIPGDVISINYLFAARVGLSEGTIVNMKPERIPPALSKITIHPETQEDLDILEMNSFALQSTWLDQLKIVIAGQKMVCWVSPTLPIKFESMHSSLLRPLTEVSICLQSNDSPDVENDESYEQTEKNKTRLNLKYYMSDVYDRIQDRYDPLDTVIFRSVIFPTSSGDCTFENCHLFDVYASEKINGFDENHIYHLHSMELQNNIKDEEKSDSNEDIFVKSLYVRVKTLTTKIIDKEINVFSTYPPLMISRGIANLLNIESGTKLALEDVPQYFMLPDIIEVFLVSQTNPYTGLELDKLFKMFISMQASAENPILINNDCTIKLSPVKDILCQIKLYPTNVKFALLCGDSFRECKVIYNQSLIQPGENRAALRSKVDSEEFCRQVECFETIIRDCVKHVEAETLLKKHLQSNLKTRNHFFILGNSGSGKTTLANLIANESGCWYTRIACRSIKGRKDIMDIIQRAIQSCERFGPSVLICDDIDSIVPSEVEGMSHQDANYYEALAHSLKYLLKRCIDVNVILTAPSMDVLHSTIRETKGELIYDTRFTIPELTKEERWIALKYIIKKNVYSTVALDDSILDRFALETESYNIRDLEDFVTKRIFQAVKKAVNTQTPLQITESTKSEEDKNNGSESWKLIGGMKHVKELLIENLCWPIKYPGLYPKQPGGILLFGPPGTGKSLIGSSVARLVDLNFICIKGPELLSKYIGQSEQSVRNIFKKAEKQKPCVLFFDEFDSLAPRRGHDSTGVTDRVVNQLLTQLDGVEGAIKGVTVMAATSRPDLLDGALLRPGRFDTTIYCGMPDQPERLEILKILSAGLTLSEDVDLNELSQITDGFTGADLRSILSTAQLSSLEEKIELLEMNKDLSKNDTKLTRNHLINAFETTRPSLTPQQLKFYDSIYARFLHKEFPSKTEEKDESSFDNRQRVTLA